MQKDNVIRTKPNLKSVKKYGNTISGKGIILAVGVERLTLEKELGEKIIKACNNYDSLLEALKMCVNYVGSIANESEAAMNAYLKANAAIKRSEL